MGFIQSVEIHLGRLIRKTFKPTIQTSPKARLLAYAEEQAEKGSRMMRSSFYWDRDSGSNVGVYVSRAAGSLIFLHESTLFSEDHEAQLREVTDLILNARSSNDKDADNFGLGTYNFILAECLEEFDRLGLPRPVEKHYED